jgi:glycerophosphoryl diester phosphodiesterase
MKLPFIPLPRRPDRPLVLGHRGASATAPENTLAAFTWAMAEGADGVELDAGRCGSGEVVVINDEETTRTCGEPGRVTALGLERIRALDAGRWKGERFRGERVPLLREVFEALPFAVVNIELKGRAGEPDGALGAGVARAIADARAGERTIVSSFDFSLLAAFRATAPRVATGLLFEPAWHRAARVALATAWLVPSAFHPALQLCTPERLAAWRAARRSIVAWTVDDPDDLARLARAGVDGLVANAPGAARAAVEAALRNG